MRIVANIPVWLLCAGAAALAACEPARIELEDRLSELGPEAAEEAGSLVVMDLMGGAGGVKVELEKLPRGPTSPSSTATVSGGGGDGEDRGVGASSSSWDPGEYEFQVWLRRRIALRETIVAPVKKQSVVIIYAHTEREPRLVEAEVDLTPPEPGTRRARITNFIEVVEPIELSFYDADDEAVGAAVSVAWGETWTGAIPSEATGYRLRPSEAVATPLDGDRPMFHAPQTAADLPCVDALPLGLVVTHRYTESRAPDGTLVRGCDHVPERYEYLPALCYAE